MMYRILINIAEFHYDFGLIDYDEFNERVGIVLWLFDELERDPRNASEEATEPKKISDSKGERIQESIVSKIDSSKLKLKNDDNWLEFLCLGL